MKPPSIARSIDLKLARSSRVVIRARHGSNLEDRDDLAYDAVPSELHP